MLRNNHNICIAIVVFGLSIGIYSGISRASDVPLIPRNVLYGNPEKTTPKISPNGTQLAYLAPVNGVLNIWIKALGKDDDHVITKETSRGIWTGCYCWASNNDILYWQDANGDENFHIFGVNIATNTIRDLTPFQGVKAAIIRLDKHYPNNALIGLNKDNPKLFDVYHLDITTGNLTLVAKNPNNVVRWLADANMQIRAAIDVNEDGTQKLLWRPDDNSEWYTLFEFNFEDTLEDELYSGLLGFSRDGKSLYLNSSLNNNTRSLIRVDCETKTLSIIASDPRYDIDRIIFNTDSYEPEIVIWQKERAKFQICNPALKEAFAIIQSISNGDLDYIQRSYDNVRWILGFKHDNKSYEFYLYDSNSKHITFLFHSRSELNNYVLAPMEPISFTSRDGLTIHGYLTCPPGKEKKNLPLVVMVHGGPFMRDNWGYNPEVQLITNRGYACLQINFRGSAGFGKAFLAAGNGEWGGKIHDDIIDGVKWAIDQKIADGKKVAIYGYSFGGYAALVGATFTPDLFCCAVDLFGPSNLITVLQTLPPYWSLAQWEQRIGKLSEPEFLKSRSPLYKIDAIKSPILVAHGANDCRIKQSESDQLVQAMKEKELPFEYIVFPDEGHWIAKPKNRFTLMKSIEKFLAQHLGGRFEE